MPQIRFIKQEGKHAIALAYTAGEVKDLAQNGYFLEAFGRLDKMMDQTLFGLLHKNFQDSDALVSALVDDDFSGWKAAHLLYKTKRIDKPLYEKIRQFKHERNTLTHDIYGHYALALQQADQIKDENDLQRKADAKARSALDSGIGAFNQLMGSLNGIQTNVKKKG